MDDRSTTIELPDSMKFLSNNLQTQLLIRQSKTDVESGYGVNENWEVTLEVLDSICTICASRALTTSFESMCFQPNGHKHRWADRFVNVAYGHGQTLGYALEQAEAQAKRFQSQIIEYNPNDFKKARIERHEHG
jgi:hypothetical protein